MLKKQITKGPSKLRMLKLSMQKKLKTITTVSNKQNTETGNVEAAQEESKLKKKAAQEESKLTMLTL